MLMNITIIGTGSVGAALGRGWAEAEHTVIFGSRHPHSDDVEALVDSIGRRASSATPDEAATAAEVVALAVPWNAADSAVAGLGDLSGKILIDCTNPLAAGLKSAVGGDTSGAEAIARWAPGAHVVKAFNTTGANNMADPNYAGTPLTMFVCGDDADAKATVAGLAEDLGFEAVDAGPLDRARLLEPMARLWIHLAMTDGLGREIGFKLLRR
jgi:hypothetical protein